MGFKYTGKYTQAFLSDSTVRAESIETDYFNNIIDLKPNEAVYIYSFKGNKLLFVKGFEKLLNIKDEELSIIELNSHYTTDFKSFIDEYHDRLLLFLYNNNQNIESFSSHAILKVKDSDIPFMLNIKVHKTDNNGNLVSIIGRCTFDPNIRTSDIVQYSLKGDFDPDFLNTINNKLHYKKCISLENIKLIELLDSETKLEEISSKLELSEDSIKIKIDNLIEKFNLKNKAELISFAKDNHLIPNQFLNFIN